MSRLCVHVNIGLYLYLGPPASNRPSRRIQTPSPSPVLSFQRIKPSWPRPGYLGNITRFNSRHVLKYRAVLHVQCSGSRGRDVLPPIEASPPFNPRVSRQRDGGRPCRRRRRTALCTSCAMLSSGGRSRPHANFRMTRSLPPFPWAWDPGLGLVLVRGHLHWDITRWLGSSARYFNAWRWPFLVLVLLPQQPPCLVDALFS